MLHGLNDCHLTWQYVAPLLAVDRRVLVPDLPGHGLSARPDASYKLSWYARVMSLWLESLNIAQADVVAHSFGGGIAQVMLLQSDHRIRRLALVAAGGLGLEVAFLLRLATVPFVVEHLGQPFMRVATSLTLERSGARYSPEQLSMLQAMNGTPGSARAFARTVRDVINWRGQRRAFSQRAHQIANLPPIALYWGDKDKIIPVAHAQAMAETLKNETLKNATLMIFPDCGHYVHHEEPKRLAHALREFLDGRQVRTDEIEGRKAHAD